MESRVYSMIPGLRSINNTRLAMHEVNWILSDISFYAGRFSSPSFASSDDASRFVVSAARAYSHYLLCANDLVGLSMQPSIWWAKFAVYRIDEVLLTSTRKFGGIAALIAAQRARAAHDPLLRTRRNAEQVERSHLSGYLVPGCYCFLCTQLRAMRRSLTEHSSESIATQ